MKITKINGFGGYGVYVDNVNLNTVTSDEWNKIQKIYLKNLLVIIRGNHIDYKTYYNLITQLGTLRSNYQLYCYKKYGKSLKKLIEQNLLDDDDKKNYEMMKKWDVQELPSLVRISGFIDKNGNKLGGFGSGDLPWHNDFSGDVAFVPNISFMGYENMKQTATGFCVTADWYESQSESFKSELNEMIVVHNFNDEWKNSTGMIKNEYSIYKNISLPEKDTKIPLVIKSPGNIKGLRVGFLTFDKIKGMSQKQSTDFFNKIKKEIFVEKYTYHHWYQNDRDLLLFDNSIVLHNRSIDPLIKESPNRLGYRLSFDIKNESNNYNPYFQEEYNIERQKRIEMTSALWSN